MNHDSLCTDTDLYYCVCVCVCVCVCACACVCVCLENEDHMNSEHSDAEVGVAAPDADPGIPPLTSF